MELLPITVACPGCGSEDVVYSCHPDCCFNHVCSVCLKSFELLTEDLGETLALAGGQAQDRDECAPTVACARCHSLSVFQAAGAEPDAANLICQSCHALLRLSVSVE